MLKRLITLASAGLVLVGCDHKAQKPTTVDAQTMSPTDKNQGSPSLTPPSYVPGPSAGQVPTPLPASQTTEYRNGDFGARIENAAVTTANRRQDGSGNLEGNISLTLFNTGNAPISVIALDGGQISIALDNGITLRTTSMSGLKSCYNTNLQACQIGQASDYTQIDPHSDVSLTLAMQADYSTPQAASIATIKAASLSTRLDLVTGPGMGKPITLSFAKFPIKNNTNSQ